MTTPPPRPLTLDDIVGTWQLLAAAATDEAGTVTHPYGPRPDGLLLYTSGGWMSATISTVGDEPTPGATYYAGRLNVDGRTLTHTVVVGAEPFGPGTVQPRMAELSPDGRRLVLTTPAGQVVRSTIRLTWERVPSDV